MDKGVALVIEPAVAVMAKVPAVVVVNVVVAMPPVVVAGVNVAPVPPVAEKVTLVPSDTAVPSAFLTVAVMVMGMLMTDDGCDAVNATEAGADELPPVVELPPPPHPAMIDMETTSNRLKKSRTFMLFLL